MDELDPDELVREIAYRMAEDPLRYTDFNPAQLRFLAAIELDEGITVVIAPMGNGTGKTFALSAIWSAIMFGSANPLFARAPFGPENWPFPKELRVVSTTTNLEDVGPIQAGMRALFPQDRWGQSRGVGKGYYSQGWTDTGFSWDVLTYNQAPLEHAGKTKGAVLMSEPPPESIFSENVARLRAGGLLVIEMTPITYAYWVKERLIKKGKLELNGKVVGKVKTVYGTIWDNCRDLHPGGQLSRAAVEAVIALWPAHERKARETGSFMAQAGRIYPVYEQKHHVLEEFPKYHQDCWDRGKVRLAHVLDPHDRKPWAMCWEATFPNDDTITVAEWPATPYEELDVSPVNDIEAYRELILATDQALGLPIDVRIIDPNFGNAPKSGRGESVKQMLAETCRRCLEPWMKKGHSREAAIVKVGESCRHRLNFVDPPDGIETGHILVRQALGEPAAGKRPKTFVMAACRNMDYGMEHYAYKENKNASQGLSTRPELIHKDFPDLKRYHQASGYAKWWEPVKQPLVLYKPKIRGGRRSFS